MAHLTDGMIGVNLDQKHAGTTTNGVNAPFALGTVRTGTDGQQYVFVQAGAAISTTTKEPFYLCVDEDYQAVKGTKALVLAGHQIAWAPQIAIADNDFFWAIRKGSNFNIKVGVSCAADITLFTTATAGVLDDTSGGATASSQVPVAGVVIVTAASTSASAGSTVREALASWPIVTVGV